MISNLLNNLLESICFIIKNPLYFIPISVLTIILYPLETLLHEIGHCIATYIAYILCKNKHKKDINFKLKIKLHWKYKLSLHKTDTNGGTTSNFREFIINKPQYTNYFLFIVLGGVIIGSVLLIIISAISIACNNIIVRTIIATIILIFLIMNLFNFLTTKDIETSDYNTYINTRRKN